MTSHTSFHSATTRGAGTPYARRPGEPTRSIVGPPPPAIFYGGEPCPLGLRGRLIPRPSCSAFVLHGWRMEEGSIY